MHDINFVDNLFVDDEVESLNSSEISDDEEIYIYEEDFLVLETSWKYRERKVKACVKGQWTLEEDKFVFLFPSYHTLIFFYYYH